MDNVQVSTPAEFGETVVALANTNGGTVLVNRQLADFIKPIAANCQPSITIRELVGSDDMIAIQVARSTTFHALADGRVLGRVGGRNRELNSQEILKLAQIRELGDFDRQPVRGASMADLAMATVDEFDVLDDIGIVDAKQQPTVAGILLFAAQPSRWIPQAHVEIKWIVGKNHVARHKTIEGPLTRLIEQLVELDPAPTYPTQAFREAIVNALVHRDYRVRVPITIELHPDTIQITSPGAPPGFAQADTLANQCYHRNPLIVAALQRQGHVRGQGTGLTIMYDALKSAGFPPPSLSAANGHLKMSLRRQPTPDSPPPSLTTRQEHILAYLEEHGSMAYRTLCVLHSDVDSQTLMQDMDVLVQRGLVLKLGGATVYALNR